MKVRYIFDRVCLQIVHFSFLRTLTCFKVQLLYIMVKSRSIHLTKNTTEYPHITQQYPQKTCEYSWKTEKQIEFFYFPETTKNYKNLIEMITMKMNGTISWHNSCYMFKIEKCAQKQQIIIAWLGIWKLAEVIKTNLGDQYN
jgi:hypothetical protein